jgi:hypothetical protein
MPVVSKVVSTHCAMRDMAGGVGVSCLSSLSSLPSSPSLSVPCDLGIRVFWRVYCGDSGRSFSSAPRGS